MTSTIERGPVLTACEKRNADAVVEWCVANCRFPEGPEYAKYNNKETHTRAAQCGVYLYANVFKYNYGYRAEDVEIAKALYKDRRVDMESVRNGSADYNVLLREDKITFGDIPEIFLTEKLCIAYLNNSRAGWNRIPKKFLKNKEVLHECIRAGMHLCDIEAADIAMDEADIECAIARDPMEVLRAPYCRKDKFRREAVRQNPHMIKPLLDMGYGDGEKLLAIAYDATTVKHMPDEDLRVYLMAVKCNPMAVWCIPAKYRTYVLLEMVIKQNPNVIANLYKKQSCASSNHEKEQLAKLALSIDGTVLRYIPEEAKTKELCDVALAQTALAREYVPASMRA